MILVGNQRGGASDLARHLMKEENDHVEIHEIRGFVASDLYGAFREADATAKGTRCKQFLFSLSLNPPQKERVNVEAFEQAIDEAEARLGLRGQPRVVVFHEKEGRRHAHAVWSRIDTRRMKAIQLSHSKRKLNVLSKDLYKEHRWRLPPGHIDRSLRDPLNFTLQEWQQAKRAGKDPREIKRAFQDAWAMSADTRSFADALEERGYTLAMGSRRSFVAVDRKGEIYAVPRQLGIKTKEVKERLGNVEKLPEAEEVKRLTIEKAEKKLSNFIRTVDSQSKAQAHALRAKLDAMVQKQREERTALVARQLSRRESEARARQQRYRKGLLGLWDHLRGEHRRVTEQNRHEAYACDVRDRKERDVQVEDHLAERRNFKRHNQKAQDNIRSLGQQRRDLKEEIRELCRVPGPKKNKNRRHDLSR